MRIGQVAALSEVAIQTIRYYERRGLLPAPAREKSGQRRYGDDVVERLRFIRRAQSLGFTLSEIGDLLALWADSRKSCAAAERRARVTAARIGEKVRDLNRMQRALSKYVTACRARRTFESCPLLSALGGEREAGEAQ